MLAVCTISNFRITHCLIQMGSLRDKERVFDGGAVRLRAAIPQVCVFYPFFVNPFSTHFLPSFFDPGMLAEDYAEIVDEEGDYSSPARDYELDRARIELSEIIGEVISQNFEPPLSYPCSHTIVHYRANLGMCIEEAGDHSPLQRHLQ